jgi:hypothetical protein
LGAGFAFLAVRTMLQLLIGLYFEGQDGRFIEETLLAAQITMNEIGHR